MDGINLEIYNLGWLNFLGWGWWIVMISFSVGLYYTGYLVGRSRAASHQQPKITKLEE